VCEVIKPVLESIVAKPKLENYLKTDIWPHTVFSFAWNISFLMELSLTKQT